MGDSREQMVEAPWVLSAAGDEDGFGPENVGLIIGIMISKTNNNGLYWEYHWNNNVGLIYSQ